MVVDMGDRYRASPGAGSPEQTATERLLTRDVGTAPPTVGKDDGEPEATGTSPAAVATAATTRTGRTIQFRTPNGTRIIWTLDPDFRISGT